MNMSISQNTISDPWDDSPMDVTKEVNFIWSIANKLRGTYQSDKYKNVIIPMTIIRRFECALEHTKKAVLEKVTANPLEPAKSLYKVSGFHFYNKSKYTLARLVDDADNLASNFKSYIGDFSENVQSIIKNLEFEKEIDKMEKHDRLYAVVKAFSEIDLDPSKIDNMTMGYIFEELIRKFSENAEAGDHYTGRDIIKLMVSVLTAEGCDDIFDNAKVITILDQASGTGGMLSIANSYIKRMNPSADIRLFSQEINPESYAMCFAEMLIRGQNADNIRLQDSMKMDCFPDTKMRFVIENPPFGTAWGGKDAAEGCENAVNAEVKKGSSGRFPAGAPGTGDMQLLFVQSALDKLDDTCGRCAIIENGSPLFTGGTSSGESQIRRWLLENDYLEAIIQLSTDMFYNTGIATYIWILSKCKSEKRKGKVQLIDASGFKHALRKSLGNKRNEISPEDRKAITKLYSDFEENEFCQIHSNEDFMYREYSVMQPLQRSYAITDERIGNMISSGALSALYDEAKVAELEGKEELSGKEKDRLNSYAASKPVYDSIIETLSNAVSDKVYNNPKTFVPVLARLIADKYNGKDLAKFVEKVAKGLSKMDKNADIQRDKAGNIIYDPDSKDIEIVPYKTNIDDYMKAEVLPHVPDAKYFFEEDLSKKKPVIKTGAEIPFTRYFYKYQEPTPSDQLQKQFLDLEKSVNERIEKLFN